MSYKVETIHSWMNPERDPGYDVFQNEDVTCQILFDGKPLVIDYLHFDEAECIERCLDSIVDWFNAHLTEEQKEATGFSDGVSFGDIKTFVEYMEILPYLAEFDVKKETDAFNRDRELYPELYD